MMTHFAFRSSAGGSAVTVYKLGGKGRLILYLHMLETLSDRVQEDTINRERHAP